MGASAAKSPKGAAPLGVDIGPPGLESRRISSVSTALGAYTLAVRCHPEEPLDDASVRQPEAKIARSESTPAKVVKAESFVVSELEIISSANSEPSTIVAALSGTSGSAAEPSGRADECAQHWEIDEDDAVGVELKTEAAQGSSAQAERIECFVVLTNISKKHNLSQILRSAGALGVQQVVVHPDSPNRLHRHSMMGRNRAQRPCHS